VPTGENDIDGVLAERVIGRPTLYNSRWEERKALWDGRRSEIVADYGTTLVAVARELEWDYVRVPTMPAAKAYSWPVMTGPYSWLDDFPGAPSLIVSCQSVSGVAGRFAGPPKIQTLHGMADKRGELFGTDRLRDFTHLFSMGPFVTRLAGSSDVFGQGTIGPTRTVNFLAAHDGFTLEDLVSYNFKHNTANRENNRDGTDENFSWNCGVEGSGSAAICARIAVRRCAQELMASAHHIITV